MILYKWLNWHGWAKTTIFIELKDIAKMRSLLFCVFLAKYTGLNHWIYGQLSFGKRIHFLLTYFLTGLLCIEWGQQRPIQMHLSVAYLAFLCITTQVFIPSLGLLSISPCFVLWGKIIFLLCGHRQGPIMMETFVSACSNVVSSRGVFPNWTTRWIRIHKLMHEAKRR